MKKTWLIRISCLLILLVAFVYYDDYIRRSIMETEFKVQHNTAAIALLVMEQIAKEEHLTIHSTGYSYSSSNPFIHLNYGFSMDKLPEISPESKQKRWEKLKAGIARKIESYWNFNPRSEVIINPQNNHVFVSELEVNDKSKSIYLTITIKTKL